MGGERIAQRKQGQIATGSLVGPVPSTEVAAVVVTHNRGSQLRTSLDSLLSQSAPLGALFVVDNASSDGTADLVQNRYPTVRMVQNRENAGAAGGFARGFKEAVDDGFKWIWAFNDDDFPDEDALQALLATLAEQPLDTGILACARRDGRGRHWPLGGTFNGKRRQVDFTTPSVSSVNVDVVAFSGTLLSSRMIRSVGVPRAEFFMMLEELDYCLRAARAGWRVRAIPLPVVTAHASGSTGSSPPWRGYYQTRNELLLARSNRSARHMFWWSVRTAKQCAATLAHGDRRSERLALRMRGAWDGWRGVTGRTVEP